MLINESTNAMNLIALGNSTGKNNVTSKNENQASFANFLQPAKKDVSNSVNSTERDVERETKNDTFVSDNSVSKEENDVIASTKTNDFAKNDSYKEVDDSQNVEETTEGMVVSDMSETNSVVDNTPNNDLMDENVEVLQEMLSSLLQQITQILDMSVAELSDRLEGLTMDFSDLLTEDGMKQLFLDINSANISDLLVDENLNEEWNQLLVKFDDIQQNLEFDEVDIPVLNDLFKEEVSVMAETVTVDNSTNMSNLVKEKSEKQTTEYVDESDLLNSAANENQPEVFVVNHITDTMKKNDTKDNANDGDTSSKEDSKKEVVNGLANAIDQLNVMSSDELMVDNVETPVTGREIVNQVVEQIRVNMNQNTTSMEMQLYPEHLGKIQINVVSKDGVMTARIVAESETAKQAIESGLANLKESFEKQDLKVDAIEVMVSTAGFTDNNDNQASYEQQRGSNSRRRMNLSGMDEEEVTDETAEEAKMEYSGSSVSYMA